MTTTLSHVPAIRSYESDLGHVIFHQSQDLRLHSYLTHDKQTACGLKYFDGPTLRLSHRLLRNSWRPKQVCSTCPMKDYGFCQWMRKLIERVSTA